VLHRHCCSPASTAWLAIIAVLGLVWLPPEHVHDMEEHGEHTELVHRHLAPHHAVESGAIFDHQDGDAHYLSSPFTVPASPAPQSSLFLVAILPELQPVPALAWTLRSIHVVRMHDPPWAFSLGLRAPPLSARHA
jgi:hypothetical protein